MENADLGLDSVELKSLQDLEAFIFQLCVNFCEDSGTELKYRTDQGELRLHNSRVDSNLRNCVAGKLNSYFCSKKWPDAEIKPLLEFDSDKDITLNFRVPSAETLRRIDEGKSLGVIAYSLTTHLSPRRAMYGDPGEYTISFETIIEPSLVFPEVWLQERTRVIGKQKVETTIPDESIQRSADHYRRMLRSVYSHISAGGPGTGKQKSY